MSRLGRLPMAALSATVLLLAAVAPVAAVGASVERGGNTWSAVVDGPNICGWPSTFELSGRDHYVVVIADEQHGQITFQTIENYTVTIANDLSVPESVRGVTWRGRNEISFIVNFDPSTDRVLQHSVQTAFEGPFREQIEKITLVIEPDGTVTRDTTLTRWFATAECDQFV